MVFNFVDKNNTGSTIKNNATGTQPQQQLVVGTIYSCKKDAVPSSAATNHFYYVRDENKLYAGQGNGNPLIEISGGSGGTAPADLSNYATKANLAAEIDDVKALIPDITKYMKTSDAVSALAKKADSADTYTKQEVDNLISGVQSGTVDLTLYLTKTDAANTYALKTHTHDMSNYATKADIANFVDDSAVDNKINAATANLGDGDLKKADADTYYAAIDHTHDDMYTKSQTDSQISAAIAQAKLNGDGNSVDLSEFLKSADAETTYLKKADAITSDTVQSMIDGAGHLTASDIAGLQNDIDTAKADAAAAKTAISEVAKDVEKLKTDVSDAKTAADNAKSAADAAQATANAAKTTADEAKTKADTNATDITNINSTISTVQNTLQETKNTADAAKAQSDENKADIENCVKKDELKSLVEQYIKELMSSGGDNGDSGSGGGPTVTPSTGGETKTMKIEAGKGATICLSSIGVEFTEEQVTSGKVHFLIMPGDKGAVEVYVRDNYPEGMEIPICYESMSGNEETKAYDKIWHDLSYENPGWINGFASSTDSDDTYDTLEMMSHTVASSWTIGVRIDD